MPDALIIHDRSSRAVSPDAERAHRPRRPAVWSRTIFGRGAGEVAGLAALLVGTAVAYLWNLTSSGYANSFYAAAVEAGTKSWKAFFFGSIDSSNFITVDKPPASLWIMELSCRIFGFSSASMLIPEVLEGVATVALLYAMLRRLFGHRIGLIAGVVMATTPVAALMFRFNNPDALLVLLMTMAAYGVSRATEKGATRWLLLAGAALGFAFLAKMGQALLVVPGMAAAYMLAAPVNWRRRLVQLLAAGAALVVAAGWWVLAVTLWPASDRPYIDGSKTNSIWNLIVDYNGFGRVVSSGGPGGGGGGSFSGATGVFRLFNSLMGAQASWLLPVAAAVLVGGLVVTARRPRVDPVRAALVLWGGWLIVTGLVFSFGQGIIHTYYTVALVPAIAALVAIGVGLLAQHWDHPVARWTAAAGVALTAWWAYQLLDRAAGWESWLRPAVVVAAVAGCVGLVVGGAVRSGGVRRFVAGAALVSASFAVLAGPTAYALETIGTAHTGSVPSAGPATTAAVGGPGGSFAGGSGGPGGSGSISGRSIKSGPSNPPSGTRPTGAPSNGSQTLEGGMPTSSTGSGELPNRSGSDPLAGGAGVGAGGPGVGAGGAGGEASTALARLLETNASHYKWVAATSGSQSAASLELATGGDPVMAIGGFSGQGGNLTLAQFERYVEAGDIHYYISSGGGGGPSGSASTSAITSWVESHFKSETVGGTTVYNLTERTS